MINRRQMLQSGIAATSLPLVAGVSLTPLASAHTRALEYPALYKVLFDRRFPASRDFGREAQWRGQNVEGFDGDITHVWYRDLHPRWQKGPAAIAGFTAHGALFCLERLAWDAGMRVIYRAEQPFEGHESLYTWIITPGSSRVSPLEKSRLRRFFRDPAQLPAAKSAVFAASHDASLRPGLSEPRASRPRHAAARGAACA
jgi:hypothetical protein